MVKRYKNSLTKSEEKPGVSMPNNLKKKKRIKNSDALRKNKPEQINEAYQAKKVSGLFLYTKI